MTRMTGPGQLVILTCAIAAGDCSAIAAIVGSADSLPVINVPAGLLVGESDVATAD